MKFFKPLAMAAAALFASGCASFIVSDEAIVDRTAFALGLNKGDITVSNRVDDGAAARYSVRTRTGQEFNCFLGGTVGILGRSVTDAVCTKKGEASKNPLVR